MKSIVASLILIFFFTQSGWAKIWRVNNNLGVNADYTSLSTAINDVTNVLAGDTIMVEASASSYSGTSITRKLVIIGPGYYLNDATPNPKTQANPNVSNIGSISFNAGSAGSVIEGCTISSVNLNESNVTIQRNNITNYVYLGNVANSVSNDDTIRQNVVYGFVSTNATTHTNNLIVYNNIVIGPPAQFGSNLNNVSGYFINNDFMYSYSTSCANFTFQNNIFHGANFGAYLSSNAFFNNITDNTGLPAGNGNQLSIDLNDVFLGYSSGTGYSSDGRYQLKTGSTAIGAGSLNGGTVDCGAFGGPAPYVLSGMPSIPSIYSLTVPTSVPSGATNMNISVSSTTVH